LNADRCYSALDFRYAAMCNTPKDIFDFIDGGAGNEDAIHANSKSYQELKLIPYIRDNVESLDLNTSVIGLSYSAPFGVAPLGLCGIIHREAELILARAAAKYNVPFITSAASNKSIAEIANACGVAPWFQLYIPKIESCLALLLNKAEVSDCPVLVVTVDASVSGRRLRDLRNGFSFPYGFTLRHILDAIRYPRWAYNQIINEKLKFPNFEGMLDGYKSVEFNEIMTLQAGGDLNWDVINRIREKWKKKLVLKGVLSETDAVKARKMGIDAVILSNHGGRQLNNAPAPLSVLPRFLRAGLDKKFLMLDSGIRSGEDILVGLSQGASFTFLGRAFLYALMAGGDEAVDRLFQILIKELSVGMKLIGCDSPEALNLNNVYI
jgi:isopentenyl diphosphate isomerase/L-lactate dehydrogenase-like FMN-dependent dehydrogenase